MPEKVSIVIYIRLFSTWKYENNKRNIEIYVQNENRFKDIYLFNFILVF